MPHLLKKHGVLRCESGGAVMTSLVALAFWSLSGVSEHAVVGMDFVRGCCKAGSRFNQTWIAFQKRSQKLAILNIR